MKTYKITMEVEVEADDEFHAWSIASCGQHWPNGGTWYIDGKPLDANKLYATRKETA